MQDQTNDSVGDTTWASASASVNQCPKHCLECIYIFYNYLL